MEALYLVIITYLLNGRAEIDIMVTTDGSTCSFIASQVKTPADAVRTVATCMSTLPKDL